MTRDVGNKRAIEEHLAGLKLDPFLKEREIHLGSCRPSLERSLEDVGYRRAVSIRGLY